MNQKLIHQMFEDQVKKTPENIAVKMGESKLTYFELNQYANWIAQYLIKKGITPDQLIGIRMHRSVQMIATILGVLKAGGAYLPLDPSYPQPHLRYIIENANPKLIINDENQYALPIHGEEVLDLSKMESEFNRDLTSNVETQIDSTNLAYCIYTSGSTGRPKGVLVEHHSVVNYLKSAIKYYQITNVDCILQFASLNFDTSVEEIFPPLISGATLVLRQNDMTGSMQRFLQQCAQFGITILDLPTAYWHELVMYLDESRQPLPSSLRLIIIGGERVSPDLLKIWHRLGHKSVRLFNTYGLTECTCVSTYSELTPEERLKFSAREVSIGKAIENVKLYVLDEKLSPVTKGESGELFIGGENLARGYLNLDNLTRERFVRDPFSSGEKRMYKTGDLVVELPDGSFEYLGRNDDQIKIRGFRIEPGEIESIILEMKMVKQAIAVKKTDPSGNDYLIAYLVPQKRQVISKLEVWKYLTEKLPRHMIPAFFIILDMLPLSPNNKIDKKSLPEPDWNHLDGRSSVLPTTETETMLLEIWEDALGRKGFGVEDDFFEIGGNSILAARIVTMVERKIQKSIPLAIFVETQTIRGMARLLENRGWEPVWQSIIPMREKGTKPPLFLVHAMWGDILSYRLLVSYMKDEDQPVYGIRACGFDGKVAPFTDLKAMAAYYLDEIKKVYPSGPYYLGGYSFGGTVAFEMAQQLTGRHEQVALLAMFDTVLLDSLSSELRLTNLEKLSDEFSRGLIGIKKWFGISSDRRSYIFKEAWKIAQNKISSILTGKRFLSPGEVEGEERKAAMPESFRKVREANIIALNSYIAEPYSGKVTLFNAKERQWSDLINPESLWKKMALGGVESFTCSGKHYSILDEPHVQDLAEKLETVLQKKQLEFINEI